MPQLKSGRHVALSASPYLDALSSEKDEARYFAILALRVHANSPETLRDHLPVSPVAAVSGRPRSLRGTLIGLIVGIGAQLVFLPLALARPLALGRRAVGLVGNLRAGFERLATAGTVSGHRRGLHAKRARNRDGPTAPARRRPDVPSHFYTHFRPFPKWV